MGYLFLIIITCLINYVEHNTQQNSNVSKVCAELVYSDYTLFLRIKNNSDDSIYVYTDIINKIEVFYNGKIVSSDFLYSFDDLSPYPDPPKYDSLNQTDNGIAAYVNWSNPKAADSVLLNYLLKEYSRLNKQEKINPEELSVLLAKFDAAMFLTGGILFLPPHDSYTFERYAFSKKNPGNYRIKCHESKKNRYEYYEAEGFTKNTTIKLPYMPPLKFMGFERYGGRLKCKSIKFII